MLRPPEIRLNNEPSKSQHSPAHVSVSDPGLQNRGISTEQDILNPPVGSGQTFLPPFIWFTCSVKKHWPTEDPRLHYSLCRLIR